VAENSNIEWTDHTFNPWIGCTKVSPGCANCYAEAHDNRFGGGHWGKGAPRQRTSEANWRKPVQWNRQEEAKLVSHAEFVNPRRPRVFCASLADWLDDEAPIEWLADLFDLIRKTPNLDWLLLTKRPENWRARVEAASDHLFDHGDRDTCGWLVAWWKHGVAPRNIWLGTTVEDQTRGIERISTLVKIPARVRFLSCEPLLAPVDLRPWFYLANNEPWNFAHPDPMAYAQERYRRATRANFIHWVICGGESGPNARPMHPDWARELRDQCAAAGVPFFFKQWGEWANAGCEAFGKVKPRAITWIRWDGSRWPHCPEDENADCVTLSCVGKKAAGRLLDGREHSEFPNASNQTPPPRA
jgi:protein gp37